MTKFISIFSFIFILSNAIAQTPFDKFTGNEKITTVVVSKKMFELMGRVKIDESDKDAQKFMQMVKNLESLRVFVTSDAKLGAELKSAADKHQKSAQLEELMSVFDGGKQVKIMVRSGKSGNQIRELLMTVDGGSKNPETVILSLTGLFDLDDVSLLSDRIDLPAKDQIKNATKKKK
jgi:hypothetical protein